MDHIAAAENNCSFGGTNKKKLTDFDLKPLKSTKLICPTQLARLCSRHIIVKAINLIIFKPN